MEESYNQKLLKEKENSLLKSKAEKDKYAELIIEKNELENQLNELKQENESMQTGKGYKNNEQKSKNNFHLNFN